MNQSEKRRRKLLEQTRNLYADKRIPAVHPRYKAVYRNLYEEDELPAGTLAVRTVISLVIFSIYVAMKYNGVSIYNIGNMQVLQMIMQNIV